MDLQIWRLVHVASWVMGVKKEGMLLNQLLHLVATAIVFNAYMIHGLCTGDLHPSKTVLYSLNGVWAVFFVPYIVLSLMYGCGGLDRF